METFLNKNIQRDSCLLIDRLHHKKQVDMSKIELTDLGVTLEQYDHQEDDTETMYIVSNTDELAMRKMFPLVISNVTFANRDQLVSYIALWIAGEEDKARTVAKLKKKPSTGYPMPEDNGEWRNWAPAIAYLVVTHAKDVSSLLRAIPNRSIGASGKDDVWELGQDKTTAERSAPPHSWGMNAWGKALTRYREKLLATASSSTNADDSAFATFLSSKLTGKDKVSSRLALMKIGKDSLWTSEDAVENFMITFRRAARKNTLQELREWIKTARVEYHDAWDFISTLPLMNSINDVFARDAEATQKFISSLSSIEKCKVCGSSVQAAEEQRRSADEPPETVLRCFNVESGCAKREIDRNTGLPVIRPYVYVYRGGAKRKLLT